MVFIRLLNEGAKVESRMLNHPLSCMLMTLLLAMVAAGMVWLTEVRMRPGQELVFEEEYPALIVSLKLT
jgi:hypothetical protein